MGRAIKNWGEEYRKAVIQQLSLWSRITQFESSWGDPQTTQQKLNCWSLVSENPCQEWLWISDSHVKVNHQGMILGQKIQSLNSAKDLLSRNERESLSSRNLSSAYSYFQMAITYVQGKNCKDSMSHFTHGCSQKNTVRMKSYLVWSWNSLWSIGAAVTHPHWKRNGSQVAETWRNSWKIWVMIAWSSPV